MTIKKINWGIISTAKIGLQKVIPGLLGSEFGEVRAIASRREARARSAADSLGIPVHYGNYEALFEDPEIDAIYNPLPNHLHVPVSIQAMRAGKHVLCEKPIAMDVAQTQELIDVAAQLPELKVMEAFMYRFHPQWIRARELVASGAVGDLKTIQTFFSYFNDDPENIRNQPETGGGGLMDIGCYPISQARFITGREPTRVIGLSDIDPSFGVDRTTTSLLDFGDVTATYTCSTQMSPYQRTQIVGTKGRIEVKIPVNAPHELSSSLFVSDGNSISEEQFAPCNQYGLQGDAFARSILDNTDVPTPLSDALANMKVIKATAESHGSGGWVTVS